MQEAEIRALVARVIGEMERSASERECRPAEVPVEASARHVHLSREAVEALFGKGKTLTKRRELSQPGQFAAEERVTILTPKGELKGVAVLGPERAKTQVEISATDAHQLGIAAPVRLSGCLDGAATVWLMSGEAVYKAEGSAIIARNHIHMSPDEAKQFGVRDGDTVNVRMQTERPVTFEDVPVRVTEASRLAMHIDLDEANACLFQNGAAGRILRSDAPRRGCGAGATDSAGCRTPEAPPKAAAPGKPKPGKRLITAQDAQALVKNGEECIRIEKGTILTPSAKDVFTGAKIRIEYE